MTSSSDKTITDFALVQLIPNMLTVAAICAGLSAIRFGVQGNYVLAVQLIVAACVLDFFDGRVARMLNSDSKMGAELDSLADFLNFGVAPPLIIYFWALQDMRGSAWIAVLLYSVCCAMRLARFNVSNKTEPDEVDPQGAFFVGVPSPAAGMLVLLPMSVSFAFTDTPLLPDLIICLNMVLVGYLMISRVPTWSLKSVRVARRNVKFALVAFAVIGAAVLTYAWITLVILCVGYIGMVLWSLLGNWSAKRH
ncbi:CDP-diacylglycerol--serine O-phosphatidyltransferase [Aliiroseovarius sp. F20344]|uniref:CDP-diacylglycerol--serine O-phosphatidyltransferase n=1 Tax=Aliiroseovarius sp. F20344 TaxID=2926414 RepID=UPI001FF38395|nr:CDP-diacylglycerol--serine O-phosphatidyltransferase [Aliiroseovarius sp. F20344]MCK0144000.1 CDP-diacylglycerol--serine O-phosphatidyltransferase [Aliiroseovarius sp. F20344]